MRDKPIIFKLLPWYFLAVAVAFPIQIMFLYGHGFSETDMIWNKLTPFNQTVMILCFLNGLLTFQVSQLIKFTIPATTGIVGVNNYIVGLWEVDYSRNLTLLATMAFGIISYSYIFAGGLKAIENPTKHWWKIPTRIKNKFPVTLEIKGLKEQFIGKTFDISRTGTFISGLKEEEFKLLPDIFKHSDEVTIHIGIGKKRKISLKGEIVRKEKGPKGNYPPGLGIKFKNDFLDFFKINSILT